MTDTNGNPESLKLEESINLSFKIFEKFCDNNELNEALGECDLHSNHDIYYSSLKSKLLIFKSLLTFDQVDLDKALESLSSTIKLCKTFRRKGFLSDLIKIIRSPDFDQYSDVEIHAELTFAMCTALYSVLRLMKSLTLVELIITINQLRISRNSFKECRLILKRRRSWQSSTSKINFEAGVLLERGLRHLILSYFPPKIISISKILGFRGVRDIAYNELTKTAYKLNGIYSRLAEMSLLSYILFVEPVGSCGRKRLDICDIILEKRLKTNPNCIAYKLFKAKFMLMNGEFDSSIEEFEHLLLDNKQIFLKIPQWELMWIYALNCQWDECIKYSQLLMEQTLHSPIITTYCSAVFRYFKAYQTNDDTLKEMATDLMKKVPNLKSKNIGNIIIFERGCVESAVQYLKNNEYLFLPIMNMLYTGNLFYLIEGNVPLLEKHLTLVADQMKVYLKMPDSTHYVDYYLDSLFYKGVLMKHMRRLIEAQHCFNTILEDIDNINENESLIPQTLMELGLIQMTVNNKTEAKKYFQKALKHFSGYTTESLVRIRIHSAIKDIDSNIETEDKNHLNIIEEYARRVSELSKI